MKGRSQHALPVMHCMRHQNEIVHIYVAVCYRSAVLVGQALTGQSRRQGLFWLGCRCKSVKKWLSCCKSFQGGAPPAVTSWLVFRRSQLVTVTAVTYGGLSTQSIGSTTGESPHRDATR